jgi:Domain of unknown function (DUF4833)
VTLEQTLCVTTPAATFLLSMTSGNRHPILMLSRRAFQMLAPATLLELCLPTVAQALPSRELFTLGRNTNANVVKYAVRTGKNGHFDGADPIEAYWLMLAENGRREELTWTERQLAYGFSVSSSTRHGCVLRLAACSERELRVRLVDNAYRAELAIAKQPAVLQRVFVCAELHALLPCVRYVEIAGINASGKSVTERILPRRVGRF